MMLGGPDEVEVGMRKRVSRGELEDPGARERVGSERTAASRALVQTSGSQGGGKHGISTLRYSQRFT